MQLKSPKENFLKSLSKHDAISQFSLVRSIDFISWSFVAFYSLILVTMQDIYFSTFPFLMNIPLFTLMYGALKLPESYLPEKEWQFVVSRIRTFSTIGAFTFPFVIFVQLTHKSTYFALCCGLAVFSLMQILIAVSEICRLISVKFNEHVLASEGKLAVRLIYVFAFLAVLIMSLYIIEPEFLRQLKERGLMDHVLKVAILLLVFPLLFPVTLIFRIKFTLIRKYKENIRNRYD